MNILLVAATEIEIQPFLGFYAISQTSAHQISIDPSINISTLVTGPGLLNTVFHLTQYIALNKVDLVINAGIAGAFDPKVQKGTIFNVYRDTIADMGAEHADGSFQDVFEMGLMDPNELTCRDAWLYPIDWKPMDQIRTATSVTVNKVSGSLSSIQKLKQKYQPDIESMEGAGVFYTCNMLKIPSLQIRAISNHVEPRNKANWDIPLAIKALNDYLIEFIQRMHTKQNIDFKNQCRLVKTIL
ncbi:MAG: futalosine hydrolase [Saprospiraceae bacterium]|nr:futalosine hydrolase [Saprospiraceae bacterium]